MKNAFFVFDSPLCRRRGVPPPEHLESKQKMEKIVENEFLKDEAKKKIKKPKTDFDSLLKIKYTF